MNRIVSIRRPKMGAVSVSRFGATRKSLTDILQYRNMIDPATCRTNAAEASAFAATFNSADVRLFWEQTPQHWIEKAELAELRKQQTLARPKRASKGR
jgi:hypothetical protein